MSSIQSYIQQLRTPSEENPLRILVSACFMGTNCWYDGGNAAAYPSIAKLRTYKNIQWIPFCPEDFAYGTPREMSDIHGGDGFDVLKGKAKVLSESGEDWSRKMIEAGKAMAKKAVEEQVELAILMDISAACGSRIIYDGNRYAIEKKYQRGMGVAAACVHEAGIPIISWREYASLELLYAKVDPKHEIDENAINFDQNEWYQTYFNL